ncbi:MAG: DUF2723 domain-containing protein [Acidobacteriota bacterium]|nr:DUF2723 domain-containing protein [Acidobacteriota bacterium]
MTRHERLAFWSLAAFCGATRLVAIARSPRDWDEVLFMFALRDYDVAQHHPHPPGFPLFIALGKLASFVTSSDFRALQVVNVLAAMLVFPAVFFFARTLSSSGSSEFLGVPRGGGATPRYSEVLRGTEVLPFVTAVLCCFFPPLWFYGGTALSDVPSLVVVTCAATLLLCGRENRNAFFLGAMVLGCAVGMRPQNLLVGFAPAILAMRKRRVSETIIAMLIGATVIATTYGLAMHATGSTERFRTAFAMQQQYVMHNDSFLSPDRPSLVSLIERFFFKPYGPSHLSVLLSLFVVAGTASRNKAAMLAAATFGPFAIFAWLMLDRFQVARYAIGYAPMLAMFAASGIVFIARRFSAIVTAFVVLLLAIWTLPLLNDVRTQLSPPIAAIERVRRAQPRSLFVGHSMTAFIDYYLPHVAYERVIDARALPVRWKGEPWLLADVTQKRGNYGPLWTFARRQYFDVALRRVTDLPQFDSGFNAERVTHDRGIVTLPSRSGATLLRLDLHPPADARGTLTITLDGRELERIPLTGQTFLNRDYEVQAHGPAKLELRVSPAAAIRLEALSWGPA